MLATDMEDLADDFAGAETALQAHLGGETEFAIDWAADLGGDADGVPIVLGHEDAFDGAAVGGEFQEITHGAVNGVKTLVDGEAAMGHFGSETIAEIFGESGCFVEIGNVALIERIIYLTSAEGPSAWPEEGEQVGDIEAE